MCCKLGVFGDQTVSKEAWPSRLPDLNQYDLYMWNTIGAETHRNYPCTEDNMKKIIIQDAVPSFHYQNS
jgi:hypothetical protein